jgi:hypothetical protein
MKSPFPGMDPFMERRWKHMHSVLITYISDQLQPQLPPDLLAQTNERVLLEHPDVEVEQSSWGSASPDVGVVERTAGGMATVLKPGAALDQAAPTGILLWDFDLPKKEKFVEIVDADTRTEVITIIELISPTNKRSGIGRDSYLAKQTATLRSTTNLVEIDLTRFGDRAAIMPWCKSLSEPWPAYLAGAYRAQPRSRHRLEYHVLPMETALKPIAIPLRKLDPDVILDLQPLVEQAYRNGRYEQTDYSAPLNPPLSYAEQAFLAQRLAERQ